VPLFLVAYECHLRRRTWAFVALFLLSISLHERMTLIWGGVAAVWVLAGERRRGVLLGLGAVGYFGLATRVIMPLANGGVAPFYFRYATTRGDAIPSVLRAVGSNLGVQLLLLLGLPLLSRISLAVIPMYAAFAWAWVHHDEVSLDPYDGHALPLLGVFFLALLEGTARLGSKLAWSPERFRRLALALLGTCLVTGVLCKHLLWLPERQSPERRAALEAIVALVPEDASVSATFHVGAHLMERVVAYGFPTVREARYVVIDRRATQGVWSESDERALAQVRAEPGARVVLDREGFLVLVRERR
jgi:hypothetical protein